MTIRQKVVPIMFIACIFLIISKMGDAMGERINYKVEIKRKFESINISNGVNKGEAIIIAQKYLIDNNLDNLLIISKASVEENNSKEGKWLLSFPTFARIKATQGLEWGSVFVDKKTGAVTYLGEGPS